MLAAAPACAPSGSPGDEPHAQIAPSGPTPLIVDGSPSTAAHDFVVVIANLVDKDGLECNANLIAPRVLLTAEHCVAVMDPKKTVECKAGSAVSTVHAIAGAFPAEHFTVYRDENLTKPFAGVKVTSIVRPSSDNMCGNDVALLILDKPIEGIPIAEVREAPVTVGETLTVVGSGAVDDALDFPAGRLERSGIVVSHVGPAAIELGGIDPTLVVPAGDFATGPGFCRGDSGGPALDASGRIVGIVSRTRLCATGPDIYSGVAAHMDLVRQALAAVDLKAGPEPTDDAGAPAPDAGDAAAPTPSSGGCSASGVRADTPFWLSLPAIAALLARRRRRA